MKYDPQNADRQVQCPACGWVGNLDQTEDQDVLTDDRGFRARRNGVHLPEVRDGSRALSLLMTTVFLPLV